MSDNIYKIDYAQFLRSFEVLPQDKLTIFLGAGTSIQAGIPSAGAMIWEFKRKLYCSELGVKEDKFKDIESDHNRRMLQEYFDLKGVYPSSGDTSEYSTYFEKCYPISRDRKLFIQKKVENQHPSIGHLCLGSLIISGKIKDVWTTNFDGLIESGINKLQAGFSYSIFSPENADRISEIHTQYPRILKLHGDYRYDPLQNTTGETKQLEDIIQSEFLEVHKDKGILIIGYSGNDISIINALTKAIDAKGFPYGLTWCIKKGDPIKPEIVELVNKANAINRCSGFVEISSFDDLLHDLYSISKINDSVIDGLSKKIFNKRKPFLAKQSDDKFPHIKLNAFRFIDFPKSIYEFETDLSGWKELKDIIKGNNLIGSLSRGKTYCFGNVDQINAAFSGRIKSKISITDLQTRWLYNDHNFFIGMLYDFIAYSLTTYLKLIKVDNGWRFYDSDSSINNTKISNEFQAYNALEISISNVAGTLYLNLIPTVEIKSKKGIPIERHQRIKLINSIVSQWYNTTYDEKLGLWHKMLLQLGNPIKLKIDIFEINIEPNFVYAGFKINDKSKYFEGAFENKEPVLQFHSTDHYYSSIHPLQGLKSYGPLDLSYNGNQYGPPVKIGIVSPNNKFKDLVNHLNELRNEIPIKSEKEYLKDFPGFDKVFKRYIDIPSEIGNKYVVTIDDTETKTLSHLEFYNLLKNKIEYFYTLRGEVDVLIIYIPDQYKRFREIKNESVYFDLHDSIKLYCAKRQIKVQIIEDKSISYFDQSKVKWWLSLGIYAKANGVPWKLSSDKSSTAYVGLGYAIKQYDSNKIVMGCSQLFDSSGQGIRFMLQQINNPIYKGKNPFMSKEDARRIISNLKESYFKMDPNAKLEKLVIHKSTHYTSDEMEGIVLALEGIPQIELLQIQQICSWRGIRKHDSKREPHNFPIKRGTTIQLDDYTFLLWTHGCVCHNELMGNNYYQGKRGIPMPIMVRRFRGEDPIETTAKEILELTKMNWNGAELYKKLPVTIDYSKRLSRMAKQMESLNNQPYDFRYFI